MNHAARHAWFRPQAANAPRTPSRRLLSTRGQTDDAGIEDSLLEWLTLGVFLEEDDNVADDHTDQADHAQECHEAEGRAHYP
jgi:hypothetical protein